MQQNEPNYNIFICPCSSLWSHVSVHAHYATEWIKLQYFYASLQLPLVPPRTSQPRVWRRPASDWPGTCRPATCATGTSRCTRSPTTNWLMPSTRRTWISRTPSWTLWGWRWTRTTSSRSRPTPAAGLAPGATACTSGRLGAVSAWERKWRTPLLRLQQIFESPNTIYSL